MALESTERNKSLAGIAPIACINIWAKARFFQVILNYTGLKPRVI